MNSFFPNVIFNSKVAFIFFYLFLFACFPLIINAQNFEQNLVNSIPKHLPIKVEILDVNRSDILSNVKIKITNTGEKPIYYLSLNISSSNNFKSQNGLRYGFPLKYGRGFWFSEEHTETDIPLKSGEYCILQVEKKSVKNFKAKLSRNFLANLGEFILEFQIINFGDKTGFVTTSGVPFPKESKESVSVKQANSIYYKVPKLFFLKRI